MHLVFKCLLIFKCMFSTVNLYGCGQKVHLIKRLKHMVSCHCLNPKGLAKAEVLSYIVPGTQVATD